MSNSKASPTLRSRGRSYGDVTRCATYLARLRAKPVDQLLLRTGTDRYPHGLAAAAVLLALDAVRAGDGTGVCGAVMDLASVLSPAGVPRAVLHAAGQAGALSEDNDADDQLIP
jgi:hypothetical protein